jgi:hypothetical protein
LLYHDLGNTETSGVARSRAAHFLREWKAYAQDGRFALNYDSRLSPPPLPAHEFPNAFSFADSGDEFPFFCEPV